MQWWRHALPVLDLESTGLDRYGQDSIVQLSLIAVRPDGSVVGSGVSTLVRPTTPMSPTAEKVHGISHERATEEGRDSHVVLFEVVSLLNKAHNRGFPLVIQNALFDWPFLITELVRHNLPVPWDLRFVDTKVLKTGIDGGYHRSALEVALEDVTGQKVKRYSHDAREDCVLTRRLLDGIVRREPKYRIPLDALQEVQRKIAGSYKHPYRSQRDELWPTGRYTFEDVAQHLLL